MLFLYSLLILGVLCEQPFITKEYLAELQASVDWEVTSYEENVFRGWTESELHALLGVKLPEEVASLPVFESDVVPPMTLSWENDKCIHEVRNQGSCGSCWAFGVAGMLSDRCCMHSKDQGWLAPQELVSCDKKNYGCQGGWPVWALNYVVSAKGLVPEACFKYQARNMPCPTKCGDGKDWKASHVCTCNGLKTCLGTANMKQCLASGPIVVTFEVCNDFFSYRSGIYKCHCSQPAGLHAVTAIGFGSDPECHWIVRNSWGASWGDKGYFKMACESCGMNGKYPDGNAMCEKVL